MAEAKDNWVAPEKILQDDINLHGTNINDGGAFRDTYNAGETINGGTLPVAVYQSSSDGELYACDADDSTKQNFIGFAISNSTDGNPIEFQGEGIVSGFSGLTYGTKYYVQTDKTLGTTATTIPVGYATSATEILIIKNAILSSNRTLYINTTQTDINTTASETNFLQQSIPGGLLGTGNAIRVKVYVDDFDCVNGRGITFRFYYGSTVVALCSTTAAATITNNKGTMEFLLVANGSTSSQKGWGVVNLVTDVSSTTINNTHLSDVGSATETSTSALNITGTVDWTGTASASNRLLVEGYTIEYLKL